MLWNTYFPRAEYPIIFFYTDRLPEDVTVPELSHKCLIMDMKQVRGGKSLAFTRENVQCGGGKLYSGMGDGRYWEKLPDFLACGIEGELEGERYVKSADMARSFLDNAPIFVARKTYLVFRRWDKLKDNEVPEVVIFFGDGDIISGLFTLANYDSEEGKGVMANFSSGCMSIISQPLKEAGSNAPSAVIGMFDLSARPYVKGDELTFSVPYGRLLQMIDNMGESFLITPTWDKIRNRIKKKYL